MTARIRPPVARAQATEPRTLVFVYGTLLAGESNHRHLARARMVAEARTQPAFTLHHLGAFPGLVAGGGHAVVGEVYEVDEVTLAILDRLEDHPRFYQRTSIVLENGATVETYLLTSAQVEGCPIITAANWRARRKDTRP